MEAVVILGVVALMLSLGGAAMWKYTVDLYSLGTLFCFWAGVACEALVFTCTVWSCLPQISWWWDWLFIIGGAAMLAGLTIMLWYLLDVSLQWIMSRMFNLSCRRY